MKVWYKLDEYVSSVQLEDDATVDDLKKAVKEEYSSNLLKNVAAPMLNVFAAEGGEPLRPGKKVSELDATTDENPLIVVAQPQWQDGELCCCSRGSYLWGEHSFSSCYRICHLRERVD